MSVTITISEKTYQKLKAVAQSEGFADVERFLDEWKQADVEDRRKLVDDITAFRKRMGEKYGVMPDSAPLVREDRER